jgi:hypothetical protein
MSALLVSWQAREDQYREWTGGTANGGPNANGRYQLTDSAGITRLVECPALLASTVSGPAAAALAHKLETIVARDTSISEATRSAAQRVLAEAALAAAVLARNQAQLARDQAANSAANAAVHAGTASVAASSSTAAYLGTQADREATTADAAAADADRILAQAAAAAAAADRAAINPVQFATRADGLAQIVGLQAALDAKLALASFTWSGLAGKPSTFAPSAHGHVIADTTGLQTALDAKLASASFTWSSLPGKPTEFAVAAHVHDASSITSGVFDIDRIPILPSQVQQMSSGDLTALTGPQQTAIKSGTIVTTTDGSRYVYSGTGTKTLAGSYVLLADVTPDWNTIAGKPSTFAPSAHAHVVADVTGLQAALDAKLASTGFTWAALPGKPTTFTPSAHSHVIADTTGLQAALDGKQASGSYSLTSHVHDWSVITGKPSTFAPSAHSHVISDVTGLQAALDAKVATGSAAVVSSLTVGAAASTTGIIYLGQNQTSPAYLYWNGGSYAMPSGPLLVNGSTVWTAATFTPASKLDTSEVSTGATGNSVARRDANGYLRAPWFETTSGGMYSTTTGVHFGIGDGAWGGYLYANTTEVQLQMRTAGGVGRGSIYANTGNVIGFLNNDNNWALQLQKVGPSFLRVNNVLRSIWTSDDMAVHSARDFVNGTLVTTDLNYPAGSGEAFILEIRGNSYGGSLPFDTVIQGYIYNNTLISVSGISNATHITGMVAMGVGGKLCFWWPRLAYWQGFNVKVYYAQANEAARNRVTSITDVVKPSGSAEVNITANVAASWTSANFDPGTKFNTSGGTLSGSIDTTNGADRSLTLRSSTSFNYQLITAGDHFQIREAQDAAKVRMHIAYPNGNVGIGTTSPVSRIHVNGIGTFGSGTDVGTPGVSQIVPNAGSPVSTRMTYGTDGTGWQFRIAKNQGGTVTDQLTIADSGNVGIGTTNPLSRLQIAYANPVSVPAAGATGHAFAAGTTGYGLAAGVLTSGNSYLQSTRWDGSATNYPLMLQPNGGALTVGGPATFNSDLTAASGTVYTSGGLIYSTNWWRSTGQTGWFNDSYATGIWSIQAGEVRTYNGSKFHSEGNLSSGGVIIAAQDGGFQNAGYSSGRNRIWSFANADTFGLSYYQGAGGWSSMDTINFHFGNSAESGAMHKFRSDGVAAHAGDLYVKGTRLPVFTSSTGAPSGGTDGDIHVTY